MIQDIEITPEFLQSLLEWSQPQVIRRRGGPMHRFVAEPTTDFEWLWHHRRAELVAIGVDRGESVGGEKQVLWWRAVPNTVNLELQRAVEASAALDADIEVPVPPGLSLRGYQKACVRYYRGKKAGLIADDMGLGKSIETIAIINDRPEWKTGLIVCPATLKINWYRELKKWLVRPMSVWIAEPSLFPKRDIVIINYELLKRFESILESKTWDFVVIDEAHRIKNPRTAQTKSVMKLQYVSRNRFALTGTPIVNEADDIFQILAFLDPITYDNPVRFKHYYSNLEVRGQHLRSNIMMRRLKGEVAKELPPKTNRLIEVECPDMSLIRDERIAWGPKAERIAQLEAAVKSAETLHDDKAYAKAMGQLDDVWSVSFQEMAPFRHRTGKAKLPIAIDYLGECIEESGKVVCFAHHRDVLEGIHKAFPGSVILYGGMSSADKQLTVDRFQNDPKCTLFVGSLLAAGVGITLTAASHCVHVEMDWRPAIMDQASDRLHRIGQLDAVLIDYLVLKDSCDAKLANRIITKRAISKEVLDSTIKG